MTMTRNKTDFRECHTLSHLHKSNEFSEHKERENRKIYRESESDPFDMSKVPLGR